MEDEEQLIKPTGGSKTRKKLKQIGPPSKLIGPHLQKISATESMDEMASLSKQNIIDKNPIRSLNSQMGRGGVVSGGSIPSARVFDGNTSAPTNSKGNQSFSSEVTKNRGSVNSMGKSNSTITTNINASSSANGAKNFNKTKTKDSSDGSYVENIKIKKTNITANVDQSGNKSFNKNKQITKQAGALVDQLVPFGDSQISGSKNKNVSISAENNIDGSKSFNKTKTKQGEISLGGYTVSPKIPTSNKEKSLSVNVGADGSKEIIKTKKKGLFGWTKNKTVTYTKN